MNFFSLISIGTFFSLILLRKSISGGIVASFFIAKWIWGGTRVKKAFLHPPLTSWFISEKNSFNMTFASKIQNVWWKLCVQSWMASAYITTLILFPSRFYDLMLERISKPNSISRTYNVINTRGKNGKGYLKDSMISAHFLCQWSQWIMSKKILLGFIFDFLFLKFQVMMDDGNVGSNIIYRIFLWELEWLVYFYTEIH